MSTWIFQGNPEVFDIEGYLAASAGLITWTVARYADQISPGDTVYIWQPKGKDAAQAGILAEGTIIEYPGVQKERSHKVHPYVLRPSAPTRAINMAPRRTYSCHLHRHKRSILL